MNSLASIPNFGIYRALTPESADEVAWFGEQARAKVIDYLGVDNLAVTPEVRTDMGVTFMSRQIALNRVWSLMDSGFDFGVFCAAIDRTVRPLEEVAVPLPTADIWVGKNSIGMLLKCDAPNVVRLRKQGEAIRQAAARTHGDALVIKLPNHITFLHWDRSQRTGAHMLAAAEREVLRDLLNREKQRCGIGSVALGKLVVGTGYLEPWPAPRYVPQRFGTGQRSYFSL